jgi:hypothetical protein
MHKLAWPVTTAASAAAAAAGVLLLVDSVEGPMPQTRFVTKKALALNKKVCYITCYIACFMTCTNST